MHSQFGSHMHKFLYFSDQNLLRLQYTFDVLDTVLKQIFSKTRIFIMIHL
jgi:hypothetical protein